MLSQAFVTSPSSPGSLTPACPSKFDSLPGLQMSSAPTQAGSSPLLGLSRHLLPLCPHCTLMGSHTGFSHKA